MGNWDHIIDEPFTVTVTVSVMWLRQAISCSCFCGSMSDGWLSKLVLLCNLRMFSKLEKSVISDKMTNLQLLLIMTDNTTNVQRVPGTVQIERGITVGSLAPSNTNTLTASVWATESLTCVYVFRLKMSYWHYISFFKETWSCNVISCCAFCVVWKRGTSWNISRRNAHLHTYSVVFLFPCFVILDGIVYLAVLPLLLMVNAGRRGEKKGKVLV